MIEERGKKRWVSNVFSDGIIGLALEVSEECEVRDRDCDGWEE